MRAICDKWDTCHQVAIRQYFSLDIEFIHWICLKPLAIKILFNSFRICFKCILWFAAYKAMFYGMFNILPIPSLFLPLSLSQLLSPPLSFSHLLSPSLSLSLSFSFSLFLSMKTKTTYVYTRNGLVSGQFIPTKICHVS